MEGGKQFMKFGQVFFNELVNILYNNLKYDDTVIIGDNSSGKSLLLRLLIEKYAQFVTCHSKELESENGKFQRT